MLIETGSHDSAGVVCVGGAQGHGTADSAEIWQAGGGPGMELVLDPCVVERLNNCFLRLATWYNGRTGGTHARSSVESCGESDGGVG